MVYQTLSVLLVDNIATWNKINIRHLSGSISINYIFIHGQAQSKSSDLTSMVVPMNRMAIFEMWSYGDSYLTLIRRFSFVPLSFC